MDELDLSPSDSEPPAISNEARTAVDQADGRSHAEKHQNALQQKRQEVREKQEQLKTLDTQLQSMQTTLDGLEYTLTRLDETDSSSTVLQTLEGGVSIEVEDRDKVRDDIEDQKGELQDQILQVEQRMEEVETELEEDVDILEDMQELRTAKQ